MSRVWGLDGALAHVGSVLEGGSNPLNPVVHLSHRLHAAGGSRSSTRVKYTDGGIGLALALPCVPQLGGLLPVPEPDEALVGILVFMI